MKSKRFFHLFFRFACALAILLLFSARLELSARTLQPANKPLDSLLKLLPTLKDSARTHTLARIALGYAQTYDAEKTSFYKGLASREARDSRLARTHYLVNFIIGDAFRSLFLNDSALYYFEIAEKYASKRPKNLELPDLYVLKGRTLAEYGRAKEGLVHLQKALAVYKRQNSYAQQVDTYTWIGFVLAWRLQDHVPALSQLETARSIYEKSKLVLPELKINLFRQMAMLYFRFDQRERAIQYINQAEKEANNYGIPRLISSVENVKAGLIYETGDFYSASLCALKAVDAARAASDPSLFASAVLQVGNAYQALNRLDSALSYYYEGLVYSKRIKKQRTLAISYHFIATVYAQKENWRLVRAYNDSSNLIFSKQRDWSYLTQVAALFARADSVEGDFKNAFLRRKEEASYKDSLKNEAGFKDFEKITEKFALERAHEKKRAQQINVQTERARQKNDRDWLQLSGAFIGVLSLLSAGAYLSHKQLSEKFGVQLIFIGVLFFLEILLEIIDRLLTNVGYNAPIYLLFPNLLAGLALTPVFHYLSYRFLKK